MATPHLVELIDRYKNAHGVSDAELARRIGITRDASKRRLSDVVYRQLRRRRKQTGGRPGRTLGGGSVVQRGQLKPRTIDSHLQ